MDDTFINVFLRFCFWNNEIFHREQRTELIDTYNKYMINFYMCTNMTFVWINETKAFVI